MLLTGAQREILCWIPESVTKCLWSHSDSLAPQTPQKEAIYLRFSCRSNGSIGHPPSAPHTQDEEVRGQEMRH